ncbi:MAG: hypothetical protein ABSC23_03905 [Bryobacteraceae bacterium]|jgi:hypothetical protein
MKTEVRTGKVEIVKQVKLTSNQRFTLLAMSNNGGRDRHLDYKLKAEFLALGLVEERDLNTPAEKRAIEAEIRACWKQVPALVKARDADGLDRLSDKIRGKLRDLSTRGFWLTKAATEYLVKGKVTITR